MSVLPLRGHGRRRATDALTAARATEQQLRAALADAGEKVADLTRRLDTATRHQADAELLVVAQQADLDDARTRCSLLEGEAAALRRELFTLRAADANADAVTVRPWERDTSDPADQATTPIDVRTLRDAAAAGLLTHLARPHN
ncbi:hypothetical protein [Streptomyces sp. UH6]|uniref:hypothetical protein n=1 Tax=Streptomyces sp. UH6 TaxID=2748379 RepID=UPI0015D4FE41|nr:hypothetical protein [Streptomyces sp. UH6]NYV73661.1 hypothetical protein [Streptomyces sp. UH6]